MEGVDWPGNPLKAHVENEGRRKEPVKRIHIEIYENGREKAEYHLGSLRHKYYIPFSKKTIDGILEKTGTDKIDSYIMVILQEDQMLIFQPLGLTV